jgi:hypothetical protein
MWGACRPQIEPRLVAWGVVVVAAANSSHARHACTLSEPYCSAVTLTRLRPALPRRGSRIDDEEAGPPGRGSSCVRGARAGSISPSLSVACAARDRSAEGTSPQLIRTPPGRGLPPPFARALSESWGRSERARSSSRQMITWGGGGARAWSLLLPPRIGTNDRADRASCICWSPSACFLCHLLAAPGNLCVCVCVWKLKRTWKLVPPGSTPPAPVLNFLVANNWTGGVSNAHCMWMHASGMCSVSHDSKLSTDKRTWV